MYSTGGAPASSSARAPAGEAGESPEETEAELVARYVPDVALPPRPHNIHVATLQLTAYEPRTFELDFFADFAMRAAHAFQIPTGRVVGLPVQTSRWTVPRSPFVNKKAMENFWRRTARRSLHVYDASDATVDRWLEFLRHHEMPDVSAKVQLFRRYPLGVGQQMKDSVGQEPGEDAVRALAREILALQTATQA